MHKKDKTITFKGKGSLFIPRNIIRSEYPEANNNDSNDNNNNDDNSEIYIDLYKPDAYGIIEDSSQDSQPYNVFDNLLDAINYAVEHDIFPEITPLYLRNDLEFQKCIRSVLAGFEVEDEEVHIEIKGIAYDVSLSGNYYLGRFGNTSYYHVSIGDIGELGEK